MSFLLDTCVLSELVKPQPNGGLIAWFGGQKANDLHISCLTIGELSKGISKLAQGKRKTHLEYWLNTQVIESFEGRIHTINTEVAFSWGVSQAESEALGKPIPLMDSLIAATAKKQNLVLVTRNVKDMENCGVKLLNPWS
jgi:predicted nucleic acid-binding protein